MSELSQIAPVDETVLVYIKAYNDGVPLEEIPEPLSITFYHTTDGQVTRVSNFGGVHSPDKLFFLKENKI